MSSGKHKQCYGTMFPQTLHGDSSRPMKGKVFAYKLLSGGMTLTERRVTHDLTAWDDCLECPEFEHCYRLSLGGLLLETAIGEK